jgi:hypothetical protein
MSHEQLLEVMVKSVTEKMGFAMERHHGDAAKAMEEVRGQTCAGWKVWEIVRKNMGI